MQDRWGWGDLLLLPLTTPFTTSRRPGSNHQTLQPESNAHTHLPESSADPQAQGSPSLSKHCRSGDASTRW